MRHRTILFRKNSIQRSFRAATLLCGLYFLVVLPLSADPIKINTAGGVFFNTGLVANSGTTLANGAADVNWQCSVNCSGNSFQALSNNPFNGAPLNWPLPPTQNTTSGAAGNPWVSSATVSGTPVSQWISFTAQVNSTPNTTTEYDYTETFNLTGFVGSTLELIGSFAVDNTVLGILINGNVVTGTNSGNSGFKTAFDITNASCTPNCGLTNGINTITFRTQNIMATSPNPTGLLVEFTSATATAVTGVPLQISGSCPANSFAPGATISVPFSASGGNTQQYVWTVTNPFTASPATGPNTTVQGNAPTSSTSFTLTLSETMIAGNTTKPASPVSRTCQIFVNPSTPLQINGFCPATAVFAPGDPISVPFSASGGNTKLYVWNVTAPFIVSPATGPNTTVQGNAPSSSTSFTVTLSETGVSSVTPAAPVSRTCQITVVQPTTPLQINGTCPTNSFLPNDPVNAPFSASGGNTKQYIWNVTAPFSVSPATGPNTSVQGNAPQQSTTFTLTLSETPPISTAAPAAQPVSITCNIVVLNSLTITGTCPSGVLAPGVPVNIPLSGSGGSGSFAWQISPTNIGLTLSSATGRTTIVQGTPAAGAQYSFVVTLSDPNSRATPATFPCTITIAGPLSIGGTCPSQPTVTGAPFSLQLTATGGVAPYKWTFSAGPLTPSSTTDSTITLSGTPTTAGNFTITATLQDSAGSTSATFTCVIRVVAPLSITGPACPVTQIQGRSVSIPVSGSGGTGNFSWTLTGPAFLSLTSSTGTTTSVTGVSNDTGTFPFTVNLADDAKTPLTAPFSCSVQIVPKLTLQPTNFPDGFVNQAYPPTTVNVIGGLQPLIFRISNGSLPPGLAIDSATGTVSGTLTQAGTFPFTVTVTDSGTGDGRQLATADYQIRVVALLQNTTACPLPTGRELQPYNAPLTATGGTGQFTFSLVGINIGQAPPSLLPPGLVLNNNAISGTPQGPFPATNLILQVTSGSQTVTFSCGITILSRQPVVTVNGLFTSAGSPLVTTTISLDAPVQEDVKGTAALSFASNLVNTAIRDNPQVQFCGGNTGDPLCSSAQKDSAGLLRLIPFTVPAGFGSVDLSPLVQSNCAGTVQIALNNLTVGSQPITAAPLQFTISRTPPVILSTPQLSRNDRNLQITVKVASSTGELSSATANFTPNSGTQIDGASSTINLSSLFQSFTPAVVDSTHPIGGCAFTLTLPYTISGDPGAISTVTLTLTNAAGSTSTAALPVP
jgi:hypothetical protein